MMTGDRRTAVLRGGAPWGFRLAGGGLSPIYIAKVRHRGKAAFGGLATGDKIISINGVSSHDKSLREINDLIDESRDHLTVEVLSSSHRRFSQSSFDSRENTPIRLLNPSTMDYSNFNSTRSATNYPNYSSSSGFNTSNYNNNSSFRDQRFYDSYGRSMANPLPALFRTAAVTANTPSTRVQAPPPSVYSTGSNRIYDTPRVYSTNQNNSGYASDCPDSRRSSQQYSSYKTPIQPTNRITVSNDANYFSDSECVGSGPRYYKISRQTNNSRRPSNVVLPIRSVTSKAYEPYIEPQSPKSQPPARFVLPQPIVLPTNDQRRKSDPTIDPELGAELLKSPVSNKKRYADSSFFQTPFNTYPTIEEQKKMARKIAAILEGGDPSQKGASKFEKQRQRAEKYAIEGEAPIPTTTMTSYRPFRPLQFNDSSSVNLSQSGLPEFVAHSLQEAQHGNPLRFVGAPDEFKQVHMQEHVTHTAVPPQAAMSLVHDLNNNRGKGAAIFQKRKARSERWVVDENNVKKSNYHPKTSFIGSTTTPWGQHAPDSWSADEAPYSGPNFSPVRPKFNLPPTSSTEPIVSTPSIPPPTPKPAKFNDFNARPRAFGSWNNESNASSTPRPSIDLKKALNLSVTSPQVSQSNETFVYPSENILTKWKSQEYSQWNQQRQQDQNQSQIPMTHEGVDFIRQRLMQQNLNKIEQKTPPNNFYNQSAVNRNFSSSNGSTQKHFTDL